MSQMVGSEMVRRTIRKENIEYYATLRDEFLVNIRIQFIVELERNKIHRDQELMKICEDNVKIIDTELLTRLMKGE